MDIHKQKKDFVKNDDPIRTFWDQRGIENTEDLPDQVQKQLELDSILSFVNPNDSVIDVGCGNGKVPLAISNVAKEVLGLEYSPKILKKAIPLAKENLSFVQGDVRDLNNIKTEYYDLALSERSLINLNNLEEQGIAVQQIHKVLKSKGKYLMLETSKQGITTLSKLRRDLGLPPIKVPWHNIPIDDDWLLDFTKDKFKHLETIEFGTYFLITRVIQPLLVAPEKPSYSHKLNSIASTLSSEFSNFNGKMSQIKLYVLEKL